MDHFDLDRDMDNWFHPSVDVVCNYSSTPNTKGGLDKQLLTMEREWVITSHSSMWMYTLIHAPDVNIGLITCERPEREVHDTQVLGKRAAAVTSKRHQRCCYRHPPCAHSPCQPPQWIGWKIYRHGDVMPWKLFPHYCILVGRIQQWLVDSPLKGPVM